MHPKTEERRTHPRIKPPYPLFVDCPLPKKVRDISVKGAFVEDTDPLPTGHKLHLQFKQEKARPVALRGVIRRAEMRRGMGVEFVDTPPERAHHLKRLLNMTTQGLTDEAAESDEAASEESVDAGGPEIAVAGAEAADAASAGINWESGLGEIPSLVDDGYRPPPPPEPEAEAEEEPPPSPRTNPLLFYSFLIVAFITAFALGLAFFYYQGLGDRAPAIAAPPPQTAETPAPIAESPGPKPESMAPERAAETPPPAKPEAQPPPAAKTNPAAPQTPAATPAAQAGFAVQVGAYEDRSKSEALARRVSTFYSGAVVIAPAQVRGKTYYRIQLPVGTREEATQLAARLAKEQKIEAWVRPLP